MLVMLLLMFGIVGFTLYRGFPKVMVYAYQVDELRVEVVKVRTTNNDLIKIVSTESEFEIEEPFTDFVKKTVGPPSLSKPGADYSFVMLVSIQFLLLGGLLATQLYEYYRNRRLLKILGEQ